MDVVELPLERLIPYARNPRKNDKAIAAVAASLKEFGWRQPIVVDEDMVILAGHTRLEAARQLGLATAPVHIARGLTPAQARAYRLMDNRASENAFTGHEGTLDAWDPTHFLAVGNELTGDRPWRGLISGIVVADTPRSAAAIRADFQAGPGAADSTATAAYDFTEGPAGMAGSGAAPAALERPVAYLHGVYPDLLSRSPRRLQDFVFSFGVFAVMGWLVAAVALRRAGVRLRSMMVHACQWGAAAQGFSAVYHRAALFLPAARQRRPRHPQREPGRGGAPDRRTRAGADRRHHRQPIGEDHRERRPRGYAAGKKIKGRKRHILTDTQGNLLSAPCGAAGLGEDDRLGARDPGRRRAGLDAGGAFDVQVLPPAAQVLVPEDPRLTRGPVRDRGADLIPAVGCARVEPVDALAAGDVALQVAAVVDRRRARNGVGMLVAVAPVRERHVVVDADEVGLLVRPERVEVEEDVARAVFADGARISPTSRRRS
jgi:hypothetical protein